MHKPRFSLKQLLEVDRYTIQLDFACMSRSSPLSSYVVLGLALKTSPKRTLSMCMHLLLPTTPNMVDR